MAGYRQFALEDVPNTRAPSRVKKELDEYVEASTFGCNVYEAEPGTIVPWGYHRHPEHEELFLVLEGELAFETPDGEYTVGPDEGFFVPMDHLNRARVAGETAARFVAVGAPKAADHTVIEETCPHCGEVTGRTFDEETEGDTVWQVLSCDQCGEETRRFS